MTTERFETVIVGGGQAGLSVAYHLTKRGRECLILEANERIGDPWRRRWPTLRLYTPAGADALPGMRFPGARHSFPTTDEFGDYLEEYARRFALTIRFGVAAQGLTREGEAYVVTAGDRRFEADNVVIATGVFQTPVVPEFAAGLDPCIRQLHSAAYRSPDQLEDGPVLVVGASHSGSDIAFEVSATHPTILSGRSNGDLPFAIEGRAARVLLPLMKLIATRVLTVSTPMGRKLRTEVRSHGGPLLRYRSGDLEAAGVERVLARTIGVENGQPVLDDGRVLAVANVVWCTGFGRDYDWIRIPILGADGYPVQERGAVDGWPGLYVVGLPFLHSFGSMLVLGAGRDAARVVKQIVKRPQRTSARDPASQALDHGVVAA